MTRRRLIHRLLGAGAMIFMAVARQAKKAVPRKFTWAAKHYKYPGGFRAPHDIFRQGKWSG